MKEIKAFIHHNRVVDVVYALKNSKFCSTPCNLSINDVNGTLNAIDNKEQNFSIELGMGIISEVKLELICQDDRVDQAVSLIRENARTGQPVAGYIFISDISDALLIEN